MPEYWYIEPLGVVIEADFDTACLIAIENGLYPKDTVFPMNEEEYQEWLGNNA